MLKKIPPTILLALSKIKEYNFEAFIVGGCVRDLLLKNDPKDWDITTSALPQEILKIFPEGKYENEFGTVIVPEKYLGDIKSKRNVEITTYRIESDYSDKRRPSKIIFAKKIEDDLMRRDFTINALALKIIDENVFKIIDLFKGEQDLKNHLLRAVGNPNDRFNEDALRMMRAVRFISQFEKQSSPDEWQIEKETFSAILKNKDLLKFISPERLGDEFTKIILSDNPTLGIKLLVKTGLMKYIIPEISDTISVEQNRHHYHGPYNTVYKHLLASLGACPSNKLEVRLASFLHDIGKPESKRGIGEFSTFYGHEYISAKKTKQILSRLKFPKRIIEKTTLLVKNHMFYYNVDEVGEKGVRKVIQKVGLGNINDLIDVRIADRLGSGTAKAVPYKLRHFKYIVEKVSTDAISVGQLKINGNDLMQKLNIKPGPKIGAILDILLSEVINDAKLNNEKFLSQRALELKNENIDGLRKIAREKIKEEKEDLNKKIKDKHWIK
ncbi:MAG: HD domain-containing protein [Parcubacteria group bacterium]|jgi:tRNA nucleotidyltransferase/poly(A) polymerase